MRQGPPRRPLATCFRAVGNELQAAVQCECRAVGGAASPWLDAGRVHWWLKGECRAGTQRDARMGPVARRRACLSGGWVCGARWAMCSCEAVCVWAWRGCREAKTRAARVPLRLWCHLVPPGHERGTHCVCAPHSPRTLWGVQLVRQGWELGGREGSPHALRGRSLPPPHPRVRRAEGVSGAPGSQEMRVCAAQRNSKFCGRGGKLPAD